MTEGSASYRAAGQAFALLIAGLGIGWLAGLSLSRVISTVLAAVMSGVGGVVAGLAAADAPPRPRVNAWPAAALVLGIALGAPAGIVARSHNVFGVDEVWRRTESTAAPAASELRSSAAVGGLYATTVEDCERLLGTREAALAGALATSRLGWAQRLARRSLTPEVSRAVVEVLCAQ